MNQQDIIRIARENGIDWFRIPGVDQVLFEKFAVSLLAAEREACAKVCEEIKWSMWEKHTKHGETRFQDVSDGASVCTYAIRARGET